jgi:N-acetyl-beta-hexosaminidase
MKDINHYASSLGIKIIPEIDTPGHSLAFAQYPSIAEYVTCKEKVFRHKMADG